MSEVSSLHPKTPKPFLLRPYSLFSKRKHKSILGNSEHKLKPTLAPASDQGGFLFQAQNLQISSGANSNSIVSDKDSSFLKVRSSDPRAHTKIKSRVQAQSAPRSDVPPESKPQIPLINNVKSNSMNAGTLNQISASLNNASPTLTHQKKSSLTFDKTTMLKNGSSRESPLPKIVIQAMSDLFISEKKNNNDSEAAPLAFQISQSTLSTKIQEHLLNRITISGDDRSAIRFCDSNLKSTLVRTAEVPETTLPQIITKSKFHPLFLNCIEKHKPKVTAKSWAILDAATSKILCSKNHEEKREMASLTKVMTCLVCLLLIKKLKMDPEKCYVTVSKTASQMIGTSANLKHGDQVTVWDLLYGLMLPSGNDAAYCLAEKFGYYLYFESDEFKLRMERNPDSLTEIKVKNPVRYFVREMNKTAKELGMTNTHYANPHGLCNKYNRSTAGDIGILCCEAMKNPIFRRIVSTQVYSGNIRESPFGPRTITWENTNKLLSKGYDGIKTGITTNAGPCLSASIRVGNYHLIIIILASKSMERRWNEVPKLVEWTLKKLEKLQASGQIKLLKELEK